MIKDMRRWYQDEHNTYNLPYGELEIFYHRNYNNYFNDQQHDIKQDDQISCGVSAIMHQQYIIIHNKFFATPTDFSYNNIWKVRIYLAHTLQQLFQNQANNINTVIDLSQDVLDDIQADDIVTISNEEQEQINIRKAIVESLETERKNHDDTNLQEAIKLSLENYNKNKKKKIKINIYRFLYIYRFPLFFFCFIIYRFFMYISFFRFMFCLLNYKKSICI